MRLEYVRSFIGVVNYKSFSRAAKSLYISQPTISTHIKQLEAELGVQLLVRSTKDVLPSEEGKIFYPYALQMIETENQALKHLKNGSHEREKNVTMAVSSEFSRAYLMSVLKLLRTKRRDISLKVIEGDDDFVLKKISDKDADIGIGGRPGNGKQQNRFLFEDEIVLITPNNDKYRKMQGSFPVRKLANEWFITRSDENEMYYCADTLEKEFDCKITPLKVAACLESPELVMYAVEAGTGIAFVNRSLAESLAAEGKLLMFPLHYNAFRKKIWLIRQEDAAQNEAISVVADAFADFIL